MIAKAPYSTDAKEVRMVKNSGNVRSLSLIKYHGRIPFDFMKENKETYVQQ